MIASTEVSSADRASRRRVPDFFIVGHPKSGTTALYEMLRAHPQVFMPELKETRFFARELHPRSEQASRYPDTLEQYLLLFAGAPPEQRAGEASPSYLRSRSAAGRIAELNPDARIIALFREPASFLHSLHLELVQDNVETEQDLGRAMALEAVRRQADQLRDSPGLVYSDYVRYAEQLQRYRAVFPREQVLVLIYDDYLADNEATVRKVLRFLGADDAAPIERTHANPTVRVRSLRMNEIVRSLYLGDGALARAVKTPIKALTPSRLRREALDTFQRRVLYGAPRPPDEALMLELRHRFKPEVLALGDQLDRDLVTLWGYGDVA
jgi:Sulfotransferase domain